MNPFNDLVTRRASQVWSVPFPRHITCLECGRRLEALGGHLSKIHSMSADQYRIRHGLVTDYPLRAREPPAPQFTVPRIHEYVKAFRLGGSGSRRCKFEFALPEFSLAVMRSSNRKLWDMIVNVRGFCRYTDSAVWVTIREFQASVILETGKGHRFELIVFQFENAVAMGMCRIHFSELW
jgi:ROS/MUCR transcriptional regulator protein